MKNIIITMIISLTMISCSSNHRQNDMDGNITVGTVQKEIRIGMNSIKVAEVLGSPNIVQTDDDRSEVWIYDKISTQVNQSSVIAGVWFLHFAAGGSSGSRTSSQRTLTIIIKFNKENKVRNFAYHTSRF